MQSAAATARQLSKILTVHPHVAESRRGSYRMWGEHGGSVLDRSDGGAARGVARSGGIIRSGGSRSRSGDAAVVGRLDERADRGGVLGAGGQRAALALG